MKNFSIAVLNASINAKAQNNGSFNFYQWLKTCHNERTDSFKEFYIKISLSFPHESWCYDKFPI